MQGFELILNGKLRSRVAMEKRGTLAIAIYLKSSGAKRSTVRFEIGATEEATPRRFIEWPHGQMRQEDTLMIKLCEIDKASKPRRITLENPREERRAKRRYFRKLEKELTRSVRSGNAK
jgi:hypothetical protein